MTTFAGHDAGPRGTASVYRRFGAVQSVIVVGASKSNPNRRAPMG
jgi:hypothetical protein